MVAILLEPSGPALTPFCAAPVFMTGAAGHRSEQFKLAKISRETGFLPVSIGYSLCFSERRLYPQCGGRRVGMTLKSMSLVCCRKDPGR